MKHRLKVGISRKPQTEGLVSFRTLSIRERILRFLLGGKVKVMVLVPGDDIDEIDIDICQIEPERAEVSKVT